MAIEVARQGGIGIIHRFLPVEAQAGRGAKGQTSGESSSDCPATHHRARRHNRKARHEMEKHDISGLMVVDEQGKLVGLLSARDVRFARNPDRAVHEAMTPRQRLVTGPADISVEEAQELFNKHKVEKLPLVEDGHVAGLITAKDLAQAGGNPLAAKDRRGRLLVGAAIGVSGDVMERTQALLEVGTDVLVVDVAHGHSDAVIALVRQLKERWPEVDVIAGNVATPEGAFDLIEAGVDGVKVGVGPGSTCTTRIVTGTGVPQFSAVLECAQSAARLVYPSSRTVGSRLRATW